MLRRMHNIAPVGPDNANTNDNLIGDDNAIGDISNMTLHMRFGPHTTITLGGYRKQEPTLCEPSKPKRGASGDETTPEITTIWIDTRPQTTHDMRT